jgi:hypothetical protein
MTIDRLHIYYTTNIMTIPYLFWFILSPTLVKFINELLRIFTESVKYFDEIWHTELVIALLPTTREFNLTVFILRNILFKDLNGHTTYDVWVLWILMKNDKPNFCYTNIIIHKFEPLVYFKIHTDDFYVNVFLLLFKLKDITFLVLISLSLMPVVTSR